MIDVCAAVLIKDGQILLAQRNCDDHNGKWEFPGGKLEANESPEQCLERELNEELSIVTKVGAFVGQSSFDYGNKHICLRAYQVKYLSGEFQCRVHTQIAWVDPADLLTYDLAEADIPLVPDIQKIFI